MSNKINNKEAKHPWFQMLNHTKCWTKNPIKAIPDRQTVVDVVPAVSSRICRFGGHITRFYSLAQHAVYVSRRVQALGGSNKEILQGLLHDAGEAFLGGDIPMPVRQCISGYDELEQGFITRVMELFDLPRSLTEVVKTADKDLLVIEAERFLAEGPMENWTHYYRPATVDRLEIIKSVIPHDASDIHPWTSTQAAALFSNRLDLLIN